MGTLFETRGHAGLAFRAHTADYNQTPALTFDYSLGQLKELSPTDDDRFLRNDITAQRQGGSSYRVTQTTGRLAMTTPQSGGVGRYDTTVTVNVADEVQLPHVAGWLLHLGTVDAERYPLVTAELGNPGVIAAGLMDALLGLDLGQRIVINNPKAGQPPGPLSLIVRGYKERADQRQLKMSLVCVPEASLEVWELESSTLGALDSATSTLAGTMTTSSTSVTVADSAVLSVPSELWTTTDVPFDIVVAGERMTVTAVSGASSPQTFTVTRAVNGIVKTHAVGESVVLYYPFVLSY